MRKSLLAFRERHGKKSNESEGGAGAGSVLVAVSSSFHDSQSPKSTAAGSHAHEPIANVSSTPPVSETPVAASQTSQAASLPLSKTPLSIMSSSPPSLVTKHVQKTDYWGQAVDALQKEDASFVDTLAALKAAASAGGEQDLTLQLQRNIMNAQEVLEAKRWKVTIGGREVVLRERFDNLIKKVSSFSPIINAVGSVDPIHAGLPIAGLCILMQMTTNDTEQYTSMVDGVEQVVTIITRYQRVEALYLPRPEAALERDFEKRLVNLYKNILRYQISAVCYYQRNTISRFLRSIPRLDSLSDVLGVISRDDEQCNQICHVFDASDARERHVELIKLLKLSSNTSSQSDPLSRHTVLIKPDSSEPTGNVHWNINRTTNTFFTGRRDILEQLQQILNRALAVTGPPEQCRIVLSGMGGQGKSELALQLANRVRASFWGVFWIDVSTSKLAESGFLEIANKIGSAAQTVNDARQALANTKKTWFLILDNADDPGFDYQDYLPSGTAGVVLITSRNTECHVYASNDNFFPLTGLSNEDAVSLLLRASRTNPPDYARYQQDAEVVAAMFNSHPLALIQAAAYVTRGHCTLAKYPNVFEKQRKRLLQFRPAQAKSRYSDVYATFEASAQALLDAGTEASNDGLDLLSVLAHFAPTNLPLRLFEEVWKSIQCGSLDEATDDGDVVHRTSWHLSHFLSLINADDDVWDDYRLLEAIHLLVSFALITIESVEDASYISMHPLTHAWAKDRQSMQEKRRSWLSTSCMIGSTDIDFWRVNLRELKPHLHAVCLPVTKDMFQCGTDIDITIVLVSCGWRLYKMLDYEAVSLLVHGIFNHLGLRRDAASETFIGLYELLGRALYSERNQEMSLDLLEQVVNIREQTLARENRTMLACRTSLAAAYMRDGQLSRAILILEDVDRMMSQKGQEDDSDLLLNRYCLAEAYTDSGKHREAVEIFEKVLDIQKRKLAEDHLEILGTQHCLAGAYCSNGQVAEAIALLKHVCQAFERTLVEEHPYRLAAQHELAKAYLANEELDKAITMMEHIVNIHKQTLAEDHTYRLTSQHMLGRAYLENGQLEEAIAIQEQVVKIQEKLLPEEHPHRLLYQHELARAYKRNDQFEKAAAILERVVDIERKMLDEEDPSRLMSQEVLSTIYWALGDKDRALTMIRHVVDVGRRVLDADHRDLKQYEEALEEMENPSEDEEEDVDSEDEEEDGDSEHQEGGAEEEPQKEDKGQRDDAHETDSRSQH